MQINHEPSTVALAATQTFVVTGLSAVLLDQRIVSLLMALFAFISLIFQVYFRYKEYKVKVKELEIKYGLQQTSED